MLAEWTRWIEETAIHADMLTFDRMAEALHAGRRARVIVTLGRFESPWVN